VSKTDSLVDSIWGLQVSVRSQGAQLVGKSCVAFAPVQVTDLLLADLMHVPGTTTQGCNMHPL
jgi:hypothetical protein